MYELVKVSPMPNHRYRVLEPISYQDILIPEGYPTNGANIPRPLWVFLPPNRSDYLPAVIVHDYLCDLGEYKKADDYFEEILHELKIGKIATFVMTKGVRIYHYFKYGVRLS